MEKEGKMMRGINQVQQSTISNNVMVVHMYALPMNHVPKIEMEI